MNNYKFNDNTLLHNCGLNLAAFVSIMKNGIVSEKYAKENNITYARNFDGSNLDDCISCIRYLYVNKDIEDSSYSVYAKNGISFILEDVDFIYDKNERFIHRSDEVLVQNYIPVSKIKGIMIPEEYMNLKLDELSYVKENSTKYVNIKDIVFAFKKFINSNDDVFDDFLRELYLINQAYSVSSNPLEKEELENDFKDVISDLNYEIGSLLDKSFSKLINNDDISFGDVLKYLNESYLNLPVYIIPSSLRSKVK